MSGMSDDHDEAWRSMGIDPDEFRLLWKERPASAAEICVEIIRDALVESCPEARAEICKLIVELALYIDGHEEESDG